MVIIWLMMVNKKLLGGWPTRNIWWLYGLIWCKIPLIIIVTYIAGWWLTYPSEKWWSESQLGWWHSQLNGKMKFMFQTTNQKTWCPNPVQRKKKVDLWKNKPLGSDRFSSRTFAVAHSSCPGWSTTWWSTAWKSPGPKWEWIHQNWEMQQFPAVQKPDCQLGEFLVCYIWRFPEMGIPQKRWMVYNGTSHLRNGW